MNMNRIFSGGVPRTKQACYARVVRPVSASSDPPSSIHDF